MTDVRGPSLLAEIERDLLDGKPVADVLRKLIILGGRAGSTPLREWATQELRGYPDLDSLPDYRRIAAPLQLDASIGPNVVRHQTISPGSLPEAAREHITNEVPFFKGIGEIEAMAEAGRDGKALRLSVPAEQELARLIDKASGEPFQHIHNIYWSVSAAALDGLVDQVKTRLAELLGELRAATPVGADVPSAAQATNAVNIVIHGKRARVQVAQTGDNGSSSADSGEGTDSPFWTLGRRIGAIVVGLATVVGAVLTWLEVQGGL